MRLDQLLKACAQQTWRSIDMSVNVLNFQASAEMPESVQTYIVWRNRKVGINEREVCSSNWNYGYTGEQRKVAKETALVLKVVRKKQNAWSPGCV